MTPCYGRFSRKDRMGRTGAAAGEEAPHRLRTPLVYLPNPLYSLLANGVRSCRVPNGGQSTLDMGAANLIPLFVS